MARISIEHEVDLDAPYMIDGMPGIGLVGKIAVDHIVSELDMTHHATARCSSIPPIAMFDQQAYHVQAPIRIYASEEHNVLALQSDVMLQPMDSQDFVQCLMNYLEELDAVPLMLSGMPADTDDSDRRLFGVSAGEAHNVLRDHDISPPKNSGAVSGPTGAFLHYARMREMDALGLIIDADPQFPDPTAAAHIVDDGVEAICGLEVDTDALLDQAEQIKAQKQKLAKLIQEMDHHERGQAYPDSMYG